MVTAIPSITVITTTVIDVTTPLTNPTAMMKMSGLHDFLLGINTNITIFEGTIPVVLVQPSPQGMGVSQRWQSERATTTLNS